MKKELHKTTTPETERDVWRTPPAVVEWLRARYGFRIDLAADADNAVCEHFFAQDGMRGRVGNRICLGDGLSNAWLGAWSTTSVGFCNPPYSSIAPWVEKARIEALRGFVCVMLIPTINGEEWGASVFAAAREIIFIAGRLSFLSASTGKPAAGQMRGSMVCVFGPHSNPTPAVSMIQKNEILH